MKKPDSRTKRKPDWPAYASLRWRRCERLAKFKIRYGRG